MKILPKENEIAIVEEHKCHAVRHLEDLAHEVDVLRAEVRRGEKQHHEDCQKIWIKIGVLMVALAAVLPTGWAGFLGLI